MGKTVADELRTIRMRVEGTAMRLAGDPSPAAERRRARCLQVAGLMLAAEGVAREDAAPVIEAEPERQAVEVAANDLY